MTVKAAVHMDVLLLAGYYLNLLVLASEHLVENLRLPTVTFQLLPGRLSISQSSDQYPAAKHNSASRLADLI